MKIKIYLALNAFIIILFFWSEKYQKNICDNKCASDYFFNYVEDKRGCYKCDDENGGGLISCNP